MITQTLKTSLLMKQEEILILRENDKNNQIKFLFNDLTGITSAEFRLIKPDDTFVIVTGEIDADDNSITFDVDEQMCATPGNARFNIRLLGDNMNVYTYVSRCIIDINLDLDNAIESTAEVNGYTFPDDFATKTYVNEAIAEVPTYTPPNYSTVEQDTGLKWIDGKPIYQKTYHITESAETEEKDYDISSDNVDTMIECTGLVKAGTWGGNNVFTAPRIGDGTYFVSLSATDTTITITAKSYKFTEAYVTLKYTKTTDTV